VTVVDISKASLRFGKEKLISCDYNGLFKGLQISTFYIIKQLAFSAQLFINLLYIYINL